MGEACAFFFFFFLSLCSQPLTQMKTTHALLCVRDFGDAKAKVGGASLTALIWRWGQVREGQKWGGGDAKAPTWPEPHRRLP